MKTNVLKTLMVPLLNSNYMKTYLNRKTRQTIVFAALCAMAIECSVESKAEIDRYKVDFTYQDGGYQILSASERTVAVTQNYDIDSADAPDARQKAQYVRDDVGPNGVLMGNGLSGPVVVIPQTVYDGEGTPYTVTDLATGAIDYVSTDVLVLPPTLERLNKSIRNVYGMSELYLPEGLKEIEGIIYCRDLKTLHIPWNVEVIKKYSLRNCGLENIYLPPSVKIIEDGVLSKCSDLRLAMLSGVESIGERCFSECESYLWANLPETLRTLGEGCFNDCGKLKLVSLPWTEIKMGGCFNGCPEIKRIEVLAEEPYTFPVNSFLDVDRGKCTLVVPVGTEEKYRAAEGWKEFHNIVGELPAMSGSGVAERLASDFRVFGDNGILTVISRSSVPVEVHSLGGEKIATVRKAGVSEISLPTGIYIVSSPYGSRKVSVM